jgi:hypothetical protein
MRCSKCSHEVKPVVAVDIDGTLGDFHTHFIEFALTYLGLSDETSWSMFEIQAWGDPQSIKRREEPLYDGRRPFKEWGCEAWGIDVRTWHDIKLAYRQGAQKRSMPVYDGATELCKQIREYGAELWVTTTRPYLRMDNIDPDTRAWLERYNIEYDGLLYDELKYSRLASLVDRERVVAVLDDLPEQFEAASEHFGWRIPILRRTPYNRGIASEQKATNLWDAMRIINGRIEEWKVKHGAE